jgi:hypothetical protein
MGGRLYNSRYFGQDKSKAMNSLSKLLIEIPVQVCTNIPMTLEDIKEHVNTVLTSRGENLNSDNFKFCRLTCDTGPISEGKNPEFGTICELMDDSFTWRHKFQLTITLIAKDQLDEKIRSRGGSCHDAPESFRDLSKVNMGKQAAVSIRMGDNLKETKYDHFRKIIFTDKKPEDKIMAIYRLLELASQMVPLEPPHSVQGYKERICDKLSTLSFMRPRPKLPDGVQYNDQNVLDKEEQRGDDLPRIISNDRFLCRGEDMVQRTLTMKEMLEMEVIQIQTAQRCGRRNAIDKGEWFLITTINNIVTRDPKYNHTFILKGPFYNGFDLDELNCLNEKILRWEHFVIKLPPIDEDSIPSIDED